MLKKLKQLKNCSSPKQKCSVYRPYDWAFLYRTKNVTTKPANTDLDPAGAPYAGPVKEQANQMRRPRRPERVNEQQNNETCGV